VSNQARGFPPVADIIPAGNADVEDADYIARHTLICCAVADYSLQFFDASSIAPDRLGFQKLQALALTGVIGLSRTADEATGAS